jgi:FKBP-type peptidyl-prolyl cis-trans isomerase
MKVGGIRRLYIPSDKAYGAASQAGIPANSDLVFDITLHEVK